MRNSLSVTGRENQLGNVWLWWNSLKHWTSASECGGSVCVWGCGSRGKKIYIWGGGHKRHILRSCREWNLRTRYHIKDAAHYLIKKKHTHPRLKQILCASNTDEICLLRCNFSERQTNNLSNCLFEWRERRFSGWFYIQYLPFGHLANAAVQATSSEAQSSQQAIKSFVTKNTTLEAKTRQYRSSATNLCRNWCIWDPRNK